MKLSTRAEYGTRALIELALHFEEKTPLMLQTIAERQKISKKYLEQLFIPLRKAGLIEGVRGPSGGYKLAHSPYDIYLKEVVEILEGPLAITSCLDGTRICQRAGCCATQEVWAKVTEAIENVLKDISLGQLLARHKYLTEHCQPTSLPFMDESHEEKEKS